MSAKIAKKSVWLGTVEALDKSAAVAKAPETEAWRQYAAEPRRAGRRADPSYDVG
jgi:hypothetical protein